MGQSAPKLLQPDTNYIYQPTSNHLRHISCTVERFQTPRRNTPPPFTTTHTMSITTATGGDHQRCLDGVQLVDDF